MKNRCRFSATVAFGVLLPLANPSSGAQWATSAGVAPAVTYTDNVCLSADDEQGEWIALVTPDVSITGNGPRANLNLAASVEVNSLTDSKIEELGCNPAGLGTRQQYAPQLYANADAILVDKWFYIDANAYVGQNEVSSFFAGGGDSLNRTGNTNTTARYAVSPFVSRRFKDTADLLLRYTWDEQYNSEDFLGESTGETVLFTLGNNPAIASFFWGLQADYSNIEYDETPSRPANNSELTSARLSLGYQFNRSWQINGFYGEERNDFVSFSDEIDGDMWDVGIRWTPNSRTVVEAGTGDRFFGNTPRFSVNHEYKHSVFKASYSRDLTYDRNIRTLGDGSSGDDGFSQPVDPITGLPIGAGDNQTTTSTSPILDERFTLGYSYNWRRSTLKVNASHSDQTRAEDGRNSTFRNFSVGLDRRLSRQITIDGRLSWNNQQPSGERSDLVVDSETWRLFLGIKRTINSNTDILLDYRLTDRQSDRAFDEYTENRITLTIRFRV